MQVVPFCREECRSQVALGLLKDDPSLSDNKINWGDFPKLSVIKDIHTQAMAETTKELSQTQLAKQGTTDAQVLAALRGVRLVDPDSVQAAFLCTVRGTADRAKVTVGRKLMDTAIGVSNDIANDDVTAGPGKCACL